MEGRAARRACAPSIGAPLLRVAVARRSYILRSQLRARWRWIPERRWIGLKFQNKQLAAARSKEERSKKDKIINKWQNYEKSFLPEIGANHHQRHFLSPARTFDSDRKVRWKGNSVSCLSLAIRGSQIQIAFFWVKWSKTDHYSSNCAIKKSYSRAGSWARRELKSRALASACPWNSIFGSHSINWK
jgi:hypothetical protein